jgi:hypothetical protein
MNAWKFHDPGEIFMEFPWNIMDQKWNTCGTKYISRDYWCTTNDEPIKTSNKLL